MPAAHQQLALLPRPTRVSRRAGRFVLDPHTRVHAGPGTAQAADLLRALLTPATGLTLGPADEGRVVLALDEALGGLGEEGYGLTVGPDALLLRAARPAGLLHGVQTLRQLLPPAALGDAPVRRTRWELPCVQITDTPRLARRGVMVDVARHLQPLAWLHRLVDLLALHKLNVLHLHLTDDQGWRMPVPALPRLTEVGAHRAESAGDGVPHGGHYTTAELHGLVAHAASRGVTVVPEIELPGHVRAALAAYPHLGNFPDTQHEVWTRWGVCENILGVHDEALAFCRTVLDEVMDVFPSPYVHVGGDECPITEWHTAPSARERVRAAGLPGPQALHGWFMGQIGAHLVAHGRRPLAWTESGADLPGSFTALAWRDAAHGHEAARAGHDVIMAPYRTSYLDYPQSGDPAEPAGQPGLLTLRAVYEAETVPRSWEAEAARRVLGTQAQLWSEYAPTPAHLEYLAFPRLAALAERAWSTHQDWTGFTRRLDHHQERLDALGVQGRRWTATPPPGEETA